MTDGGGRGGRRGGCGGCGGRGGGGGGRGGSRRRGRSDSHRHDSNPDTRRMGRVGLQ